MPKRKTDKPHLTAPAKRELLTKMSEKGMSVYKMAQKLGIGKFQCTFLLKKWGLFPIKRLGKDAYMIIGLLCRTTLTFREIATKHKTTKMAVAMIYWDCLDNKIPVKLRTEAKNWETEYLARPVVYKDKKPHTKKVVPESTYVPDLY